MDSIGQRHPLNVLGVILIILECARKKQPGIFRSDRKDFPDKTLKNKIRRDISVSEASIFGKPVFETDPESRAGEDYLGMTKEILQRLK